MALVEFKVYSDSGLTTELVTNLIFSHNNDGSTGDIDKIIYIGATNAAFTLQTAVNGGVDQITLTINDSDGSALTPKPADLKLALTLIGLDTAVAGDPLNLGVSIGGGVGSALPVYIRGTQADGAGTDLTIDTNALSEA